MDDNLKKPAFPDITAKEWGLDGGVAAVAHFTENPGFSKLELASLMIAQGRFSSGMSVIYMDDFAKNCVNAARAIINAANK